jgi:hypothetical protein
MKTVFGLILFVLLTANGTFAQWKSDGKLANDEPNRKTIKGFGGQLLVVQDPRKFIEMWKKPETPQFESAKQVGFDESIGILVLFAGCKEGEKGACNTEVDYTVYKPDGSIFAERKKQPLWKEMGPPRKNTQLGRAILPFRMVKDNPSGKYKVKAKISDLNADISFDLETQFSLK